MSSKRIKPEKTRFDTRLSKEQKQLFERAAALGGYRSLSDFVVSIAEERAQEIISQSETIIASKRDGEIFFNAIFNPGEPNQALIQAFQKYNELVSE